MRSGKVVSPPRPRLRLGWHPAIVANANQGVCVNDLTDHLLLDELSVASAMGEAPVTVEAAVPIPTTSY